jgi:hypothetical protein
MFVSSHRSVCVFRNLKQVSPFMLQIYVTSSQTWVYYFLGFVLSTIRQTRQTHCQNSTRLGVPQTYMSMLFFEEPAPYYIGLMPEVPVL